MATESEQPVAPADAAAAAAAADAADTAPIDYGDGQSEEETPDSAIATTADVVREMRRLFRKMDKRLDELDDRLDNVEYDVGQLTEKVDEQDRDDDGDKE